MLCGQLICFVSKQCITEVLLRGRAFRRGYYSAQLWHVIHTEYSMNMPMGVPQHGGQGPRTRDVTVSTYARVTVQLRMANFKGDIKEHTEGSQ